MGIDHKIMPPLPGGIPSWGNVLNILPPGDSPLGGINVNI